MYVASSWICFCGSPLLVLQPRPFCFWLACPSLAEAAAEAAVEAAAEGASLLMSLHPRVHIYPRMAAAVAAAVVAAVAAGRLGSGCKRKVQRPRLQVSWR